MPANGRLSVAAGFKGAAEGMSTDVRNCTFRTNPADYGRNLGREGVSTKAFEPSPSVGRR
jgi:hypothetical protein